MVQAAMTGVPGILRVVLSVPSQVLVLLCAIMLTGCAEDSKKVSPNTNGKHPTTAPAITAMDKAAIEFYGKGNAAPTPEETKLIQAVCQRQEFISTAPWTRLAPPKDYPCDSCKGNHHAETPAKTDAKKIAKQPENKLAQEAPVKKIVKQETPKPAEPKEIIIEQTVISLAAKHFVSTAPWSRLAPPKDYDEPVKTEDPKVWLPKTKQVAKKSTPKKIVEPVKTTKKPAAKKSNFIANILKTRVTKAVTPAKKTKPNWTWPSAAQLQCRSRTGQNFPATTPWALVAPASQQTANLEMNMTTAAMPQLPADSRRMICELRIVRVADGRVMSSASAIATCGNISRLARALVGEFGRDGNIPIGADVISISLSNREGTDQGLLLAEKMTEQVSTALKRASKFRFLKQLDLRDVLPEEPKLESARTITAKPVKQLINTAKYIVVGGVALQHPVPVTLPTREETDSLASRSDYYAD